jgi:quercetin dioxygenase-like cupin family protein
VNVDVGLPQTPSSYLQIMQGKGRCVTIHARRGQTLPYHQQDPSMPDVRADFSQATCVPPEAFAWISSRQGDVERVMLDRVGDEVAVATSLVRYRPGACFPTHEHGLGEEYLVLEGEFADEHGRYPPGTYVRNPPGSRHASFSDAGCIIWVKLRQFHPEDDRHVVIDVAGPIPAEGSAPRQLHRHLGETVTVIVAGAEAVVTMPAGNHLQEVLVIEGAVRWRDQAIGKHGWLRVPAGEALELTVTAPSRLLHKTRPAFALPGGDISSAISAASAETQTTPTR